MHPARLTSIRSLTLRPAMLALGVAVVTAISAAGPAHAIGFTDDFRLQDCQWKHKGKANRFFPLKPGHQIVIEGDDDGELGRVELTILSDTERITLPIDGQMRTIRTRVFEEQEFIDGELVEVSRNFVAICRHTSDVFYFGEDVDIYEDGEIVSHDGEWRAGEDGAMPGLLMPGSFLLGSKYYQELAPEAEALDRGTNVEIGITIPTPAGTFEGCVGVLDTTPLDPEAGDPKVYCPGVGLVMDEDLILIDFNE